MRSPTSGPRSTGPPLGPDLGPLYTDTVTQWIDGVVAGCEQHGIHGVSIIINIDDGYLHASAGINPTRERMMAAIGRAGLNLVRSFYHGRPGGTC